MSLFLLLNTKEDILNNVGNQIVSSILILLKSMGTSTFWLPSFYFCVQQNNDKNKEKVSNYLGVSK